MDGGAEIIITLTSTSITLLVLELVGFIGFLLITLRIWMVARLLESERLEYTAYAFLLLSMSQLLMALSCVVANPNLSTALYVASGASAALGFYPLTGAIPTNGEKGRLYALLPIPLLYKVVVSLPDISAGILGLKITSSIESKSRILLLGVASTFLLRGLIVALTILAPPLTLVTITLIIVELVRASIIVALSVRYIVQAGGL